MKDTAMPATPAIHILLAIALLVSLGACSAILRNPVPDEMHLETTVLDQPNLRIWGDAYDPSQLGLDQTDQEFKAAFSGIMHREHNYLAISGGGANGAYGAGVMVGWSTLGTRPEFTMVTGVSTGALTAPFVFLGPEYDDELKLLYTTLDTSRILFRRSVFSIVRGDAIIDSTPLRDILDQFITEEMVAKMAREYRRGRILNIGTTNLDAGRPVIWNIGRIANSSHPDAAKLIRQILLASASIPGVFPPVYIQVHTPDGRSYDEMHVDGGTSTQMFLYPTAANVSEILELMDVRGTPTAYVIRNSRIQPRYDPVRARLPDIAGRSVSSLIRTQGIGDAYRIAAVTYRDGIELEMTWIPANAPSDPGNEVFDPAYMSALFEFGYQRVINGRAWSEVDLSRLIPAAIE
ncbi:MAG: patatin-like phospholipase family protein [Halioglobus sp.]|nr:patatin-like phospholipase family protein [Halioglobus sp.]